MKLSGRLNIFMKLAVFVFVCFCIINIFKLQLEFDDLKKQRDILQAKKDDLEDSIEEMQDELSKPLDEEAIMDIARDNGYCLPGDIVIFNDR
ncbi:MAG: septum formation initiator family protein [Lachnospiraceae bacterium]|nr:septum formation initiator family protein [Lachnospiraceae bacterium]